MADELVQKPSNPVGRPSAITDDVAKKLEDALRLGAKIVAACAYAGISTPTYYKHLDEDEAFSNRMADAQNYAVLLARRIVVTRMAGEKTPDEEKVELAKWYLEKHDVKPEFGVQQNTQVNVFSELKEKYTIHKEEKVVDLPPITLDDNDGKPA